MSCDGKISNALLFDYRTFSSACASAARTHVSREKRGMLFRCLDARLNIRERT